MLLHEASGHRAHASTRFNTPAQQVHQRLLKTGQKRAYSIEFEQSWRNIKLPHAHRSDVQCYAMDCLFIAAIVPAVRRRCICFYNARSV